MAAFDPADPLVGAPCVIVVDACSMLDIVRLPIRDQGVADAASIDGLLSASAAGEVILAIPEVIDIEYLSHRTNQEAATRGELRKLHAGLLADAAALQKLRHRCGLGADELPGALPQREWGDALSARFGSSADEVHGTLTLLARDAGDEARGFDRTVKREPPAVRGAGSVNDSVLCETALRLAAHRPRGTTGLLTSNDRDFRRAQVLHPALAEEYDTHGLVDLRSWGDALSLTRSVSVAS